MISRDQGLERIREMRAKLKAEGLDGPFTLAVRPSTLREWGGIPAGALPPDVRIAVCEWLPPDEVQLLDEDQYAEVEEQWQDFLSLPET